MRTITELEIKSFNDFIDITRKYPGAYYRGHADGKNWKLKPSIARILDKNKKFSLYSFSGWSGLEKNILNRFKRHAFPYLKTIPQSDIDWLVLGQHYGLPTRLLDWSENPLIALFFALSEIFNSESHVWIIEPSYSWSEQMSLKKLKCIQLYFPKLLDNRIISQRGCFTIQPFFDDFKPIISLDEYFPQTEIGMGINDLVKVIIPNDKELKQYMFRQLLDLGIDFNFIYPDLNGLSRRIIYEIENSIDKF